MTQIKLKQADVYEADGFVSVADGTPVIDILGTPYTLEKLAEVMPLDDATRGFARSVVLDAMKYVAGYEAKGAKKAEEQAAIREAEEARLKAQAEHIEPLLADAAVKEVLDAMAAIGFGAEHFEARLSFKTGVLSFEIESGLTPEVLEAASEGLSQTSLGLRFDSVDGWVPSVKKAAGTRAKGVPVLQDGARRLNDGKASGETANFLTCGGRIYVYTVDGLKYYPAKEFLQGFTVETGNVNNPTRPWSQPSKTVASVSSWTRELSAEERADIDASNASEAADDAD